MPRADTAIRSVGGSSEDAGRKQYLGEVHALGEMHLCGDQETPRVDGFREAARDRSSRCRTYYSVQASEASRIAVDPRTAYNERHSWELLTR